MVNLIKAVLIVAAFAVLMSMCGCRIMPRRIGYYEGQVLIDCDNPKGIDQVRRCDQIEYFYGLNHNTIERP